MMRVIINPQMQFGQTDISQIFIDPKSRDDIPQVLRGLKLIYQDIQTRDKIFDLLKKGIAPKVSKRTGRPGMELWKILVFGVLRVNLNLDYDKLHELANNHKAIREMLGHSCINWVDKYYYEVQVLKDNISLCTPELLDQINQEVVKAGYKLIKKKDEAALHGRCDSFVVESKVHFPTDINLLLDATRTVIRLIASICESRNLSNWRQSSYNIRKLKTLERAAAASKRSKSKRTVKQLLSADVKIKEAHFEYITFAQSYLDKAASTLDELEIKASGEIKIENDIRTFIAHGNRQIDQINRRVILGESIAHEEKVFSLFKPYTEWISKGKAGVPVELGLRVCIMEDQYQFINYAKVMEKQTDDQVAVEMVQETKKRFGIMASASFDKGFHSPANQELLAAELSLVVLPRKGKLTKAAKEIESTPAFKKERRQHSAVESAINALEVHGLDYCPDYGIESFKRYVGLAVLGRNIQRIGVLAREKEKKKTQKQKNKIYDQVYKSAA